MPIIGSLIDTYDDDELPSNHQMRPGAVDVEGRGVTWMHRMVWVGRDGRTHVPGGKCGCHPICVEESDKTQDWFWTDCVYQLCASN